MRILIVVDTKYLADAIAHVIKRASHKVDVVNDGLSGLEYARTGDYDVIVLDNMLPKMSGVEVSKTLRKEGFDTPIIILSAKSEIDDRIEGLDAGADDYLVKPFKVGELLARIRALTRRNHHKLDGNQITIGNVTLHPDSASISSGELSVDLTAKEFLLIECLASKAGKIVSKEALFQRAWGHELFNEDTYIEVYISYLRKKLSQINGNVTIKAVRGLGYILKENKDI